MNASEKIRVMVKELDDIVERDVQPIVERVIGAGVTVAFFLVCIAAAYTPGDVHLIYLRALVRLEMWKDFLF